jgi:anthranilate phosphoribosyltransferase
MTAMAPKDILPRDILRDLAKGVQYDALTFADALDSMSAPTTTPLQQAAFLSLLRGRGETVAEITGAATLLRQRMIRIDAPANAIDIVGTGGDGHGTFNISTAVAFVVAGTGLPVAKHGNRAVSSKSGASDVLAAFGVKLDAGPSTVERAIRETNVGFLWAPLYHPVMKVWAPVRAELGFRTLFNLLGPLSNPANVTHHVLGVFDRAYVVPMAETLRNLGSQRAWVVHGADGLDELTTTGVTHVAELRDGLIHAFDVTPQDAGLPLATLADLAGGDAQANAIAMSAVLAGADGPYRDIVLLNAAAALIVAGKVIDLKSGVALAATSIDSGAARKAIDDMIDITTAHS